MRYPILAPAVLTTFLIASRSHGHETSPWEFSGAGSLALSGGNSDSVAYSLQFLGSYVRDGHEAWLGADYFYSENGGIRGTDNFKLSGQYQRDISDRWYLGVYGSYFRDNEADIDSLVNANLLLGYRAIDRDDMKLTIEGGPGHAWEDQGGVRDDFATLRLVQRFEYRLDEYSKLWQLIGWTPRIDDFSDSLLEFEAGVETRVTNHVSLRTFIRHRVDSTPATGKGESDTALLLGLNYHLGGLPEPSAENGERRSLMPADDAAPEKQNGWHSTAALGFSLNKGNSDKLGYNFTSNTSYRDERNEWLAGISWLSAEADGTTSNDRLSARTQFNRHNGRRSYCGGALDFLYDNPADIDYRMTPAALVGYSIIRNDDTRLSIEAGPSYTFEKTGGVGESYASAVLAQHYSHRFNGRFAVSQSVVHTTELADLENHSTIFTASLDTTINSRLIWRVGVEYSYEGTPAPGRERHDSHLTSSFAFRF